ncbi:uncharacterized protein Hap1MRO34_004637 isoform 2-T2 [Clarias gariepinus]
MTPGIIRFSVMVLGNTMNSHKTFLDYLMISQKLYEVFSLDDSDVIIAFVPIVSRAGTDISAAMEKIPEGKPVVLVVLHHTFDQHYIAPDSRLCVKRNRVFAVDCLFHKDQGLLRCQRNNDAARAVMEHLNLTVSFLCNQEDEHKPLVRQNTTHHQGQRLLLMDYIICILLCVVDLIVIAMVIVVVINMIVMPHS